jgi:vancomycin resistance protein YoaR
MQLTHPPRSDASHFRRNLGYFLAGPITLMVIAVLLLAFTVVTYQSRHNGRIYTGVSVWGVDVGQLSPEEARSVLDALFPYAKEEAIIFTDPATDQQWSKLPAELGISFDLDRTVDAALSIGRVGGPVTQFREMFGSWYYGRNVAPILLFDEGKMDSTLASLAAEIDKLPLNATLDLNAGAPGYIPGRPGRSLDIADLRRRLVTPITTFRQAQVELLIHDVQPAVTDNSATVSLIQQLIDGGPFTFYIGEPLDDSDLQRITLTEETMRSWMRSEQVTDPDGRIHHQVYLDENQVRHWLTQLASQVYRQAVNARFYFNDDTRELVLVSPHINGRELNVEATLARFTQQFTSSNRSIQLAVEQIVPVVNSGATAAELGITELITQTTTWFYGSSDARKHNIARSASNFYGIVIAPGEEFSFNRYLGTVTEDDGYEEGLIIVGGRTIKGIGGGVCQVSTTVFQTAYWAGFPITERWQHGYMLGYYNDGEGPGMDATVFSPIVDLRFINNTPHHLLIENYYYEVNEALTFKFYSTSMGRQVVKSGPIFENVVPAPESPDEDIWEFDEDLGSGEVSQIDWATEGADVTVQRIVYNAAGEEMISEFFTSHYIPYPNVYHYGPDVAAPAYDLIP